MENFIYYSELYNIYKCLFTDKQKSILELYYNENLSLSEISDIENVSKSYIGKIIKESQNKLLFYEEKLGLYKKDKLLKQKVNDIKDENMRKLIEEILK